jgi:hypothetical protein
LGLCVLEGPLTIFISGVVIREPFIITRLLIQTTSRQFFGGKATSKMKISEENKFFAKLLERERATYLLSRQGFSI